MPARPPVLQPSWREESHNTDLTKDCVLCTKSGTSATAEQTTNLNYGQKM